MEIAELQRKLDVAGDDIALINMRLDESQGMYSEQSFHIHFSWYKHDAKICMLEYAWLQMVLPPLKFFEQNLLGPRSKPEKARRLP